MFLGRKGANELMLSVLVQLVILAVIAGTLVAYVNSRADSTSFFSDFYSKDIGSLFDLAAASPSEIVINYDNIKRLPLSFKLSKGKFSVFNSEDGVDSESSVFFFGVPESTVVISSLFNKPIFLSIDGRGSLLSLVDTGAYLKECSIISPAFGFDDLKFKLVAHEFSPGFWSGFHSTLSPVIGTRNFNTDSRDPNIIFSVSRDKSLSISYSINDLASDSRFIACVFKKTVSLYVDSPVESSEFRGRDGVIEVDMTFPSSFSDKDIGEVVGRVVAAYVR